MGKFVGQLEVPELKYYRDAFGNQWENRHDCREIPNYGVDYFSNWMEEHKDKFPKKWMFKRWENCDFGSAEYFYCHMLAYGECRESEISYTEETKANYILAKSPEFSLSLPEPKFNRYDEYYDKYIELWNRYRDIYKIINWINDELVNVKEKIEEAHENLMKAKNYDEEKDRFYEHHYLECIEDSLLKVKKYLTELYD